MNADKITLPLVYGPSGELTGAAWEDVRGFYPSGDLVRQIERASIRAFMEKHRRHLATGTVLDFGAGEGPYRDLVRMIYVSHEKGEEIRNCPYDAVMVNQVLQYLDDPLGTLVDLYQRLRIGGHLVMTYATNWAEVEGSDRVRFTRAGMNRMLRAARFEVIAHELRAEVKLPGGFRFALGYGVVCQK